VVVHDLDIERMAVFKAKANSPWVIDANAVLPASISLECLEPVVRRDPQVIQSNRLMQHGQFAFGH
jgi:hypothetical protein